jgi:hypothetical protein
MGPEDEEEVSSRGTGGGERMTAGWKGKRGNGAETEGCTMLQTAWPKHKHNADASRHTATAIMDLTCTRFLWIFIREPCMRT